MRLSDIQEHAITNEELEIIEDWTDSLSDFCEMTDGSWGIEWDTNMGRYWSRFETKEMAEAALDAHSDRQLELLLEAREELKSRKAAAHKAAVAKGLKKKQLREAKTLGGQHPALAELLVKMRNEHKKAV